MKMVTISFVYLAKEKGLLYKQKTKTKKENPDEDLDAYRRKVCGLKNSDAESDAVPSESSEQNDNLVRFRQDLDENCQLEVTEKICKLIAELAKDETCRDKFVERGFLNIINRHLEESLNKPLEDTKNMLLKIQICRAIGNLCYCNGTYFRFVQREYILFRNEFFHNNQIHFLSLFRHRSNVVF